jgi:hypothetical protein
MAGITISYFVSPTTFVLVGNQSLGWLESSIRNESAAGFPFLEDKIGLKVLAKATATVTVARN